MKKSYHIFEYFAALDSDPHPVVKVYDTLTRVSDVRITKQDANHVLTILRKSYIISKSRSRGGTFVLLPRLFFELSHLYTRTVDADPRDFIAK